MVIPNNSRFVNNFDFLRVFAAVCILFTHSFNLLGQNNEEWIYDLTSGKVDAAFIGLSIFFSISGFLITRSSFTSSGVMHFAWKRLLRIQPLLILVCILSIVYFGFFITEFSNTAYFSDLYTWTYLRNILPVFGAQFFLPGVFGDHVDQGVNGSIWTLVLEERLYVVIGLFFLFSRWKKYFIVAAVIAANVLYIIHSYLYDSTLFLFFERAGTNYAFMFMNSGLLYVTGIPFKKLPGLFFVTGTLITLTLYLFLPLQVGICWSIPIAILGFAYFRLLINRTGYFGDFTYGVYIFSFPVQQTIIHYQDPNLKPLLLFVYTMLICLPLAVLSWYLVEKRALLYKDKLFV